MAEETPTPVATTEPAATPVATQQPLLTPAVEPAVAPVTVQAPVTMTSLRAEIPSPVVAPVVAVVTTEPVVDGPSVSDMHAKMATELAAMETARKQVENIASLERKSRLLANLRRRGATGMLSDANLLIVAPDIDPDTAEGQAALETFQTANAALFNAAKVSAVETSQQLFESIPKAPDRKFFGDAFVQNLIKHAHAESRIGK